MMYLERQMELSLEGLTSASFEGGPITIELPAYMYPLEPEEMSESRTAENRGDLALAAGRHPGGNILFVTGDGYIREIDCETHKDLPMGAVTPADFGQTLVIHARKQYEIAVSWAIDNSISLLSAGALSSGPKGTRIRYVDE